MRKKLSSTLKSNNSSKDVSPHSGGTAGLTVEGENEAGIKFDDASGASPADSLAKSPEGFTNVLDQLDEVYIMSDGEEEEEDDGTTFCQRMGGVCKNYTAMLMCVAITGLYFIVAGI